MVFEEEEAPMLIVDEYFNRSFTLLPPSRFKDMTEHELKNFLEILAETLTMCQEDPDE